MDEEQKDGEDEREGQGWFLPRLRDFCLNHRLVRFWVKYDSLIMCRILTSPNNNNDNQHYNNRGRFSGICLASECIYSCSQATLQINGNHRFESSEIHKALFLLKPNLNKIYQSNST